MAYAFDVSEPVVRVFDDEHYVTWTVTETGQVTSTTEWTIDGMPTPCTLTLLESQLVDGNAEATTIQPEVGLADAFTADSIDEVVAAGSAGANVRVSSNARVRGIASGAKLVGRSKPDVDITGNDGEVVTHVTIRVGHL